MSTYTVSIGRRIGAHGDNLGAKSWTQFRAGVEGAIADIEGSETYFAGLGGGIYEGAYEESATWVFSAPELPRAFTWALGRLARQFGQDSIAVTTGDTVFVPAAARKGVAA